MFFVIASLFSYNMVWSAWNSAMVYGAGPFVVSHVFFPEVEFGETTYFGARSYVNYGDLNDSVCSTAVQVGNVTYDNYAEWGEQYGFCDTANGSVRVPSAAVVMQTFTVLAAIFAILSTVFVCGCAGNKVGPRMTGAIAALGGISALVVFAQAASWNYYSDLRDGSGVVPVARRERSSGNIVFVGFPVLGSISFGPGFIALIFASIFLFYTALTSCMQNRRGSLVLEQNYNADQTGIEASGAQPKPTNGRVMDAVDLDQV